MRRVRPRLSVFRSHKHIYAQIIDEGRTLVSASSLEKVTNKDIKGLKKVDVAKIVGKVLAKRAKEAGIPKVTFDRGSYLYHGRVKALADASREAGLEF